VQRACGRTAAPDALGVIGRRPGGRSPRARKRDVFRRKTLAGFGERQLLRRVRHVAAQHVEQRGPVALTSLQCREARIDGDVGAVERAA